MSKAVSLAAQRWAVPCELLGSCTTGNSTSRRAALSA